MGGPAYEELAKHCLAHLATVKAARSNGGRRLLPLLVHPATLAAEAQAQASATERTAQRGKGSRA
jgi:hypothetical protein